MEVIPNVHLIRDSFVNLYMIGDDNGLTLIDSGFRRNGRKVLAAIAAIGRSPSDLRQILITHCDGDHVGGAAALQQQTGARVCASKLEAEAMADGRSSRAINPSGIIGRLINMMQFMFRFTPTRADAYLSEGEVFPVLGGLRVIATPGHTPEHVSFFAPTAGILFTGDSIISHGKELVISRGANTWDDARARESVRLQAGLGARIVCPGHGPVIMDASSKFPI
jgi:glyoxylase-like metal-dependent hydrolase (beta-lactamase superfamily II)